MGFDLNQFKKFDFNSVLKFATIGLLKQKRLLFEASMLFLILLSCCVFGVLTVAFPIIAVYLFLIPELSIFTIVPLIFFVIFLAFTLLSGAYFSYRAISFALRSIGKKVGKFSINLVIKLILSGIVSFFVAFFSIYELKFLSIAIIGVILFIAGIVSLVIAQGNFIFLILGILGILASLILFFVYYIIMVRNFVRISFASVLLVEKNLGVRESVRTSWKLTTGKAVLIFIIQLILWGIVWVIQQLIFLPLNFGFIPLGASAFSGPNLIPLILFMIIFGLVFFIIMVVSELFIMFGQVATYAQIANKRK